MPSRHLQITRILMALADFVHAGSRRVSVWHLDFEGFQGAVIAGVRGVLDTSSMLSLRSLQREALRV